MSLELLNRFESLIRQGKNIQVLEEYCVRGIEIQKTGQVDSKSRAMLSVGICHDRVVVPVDWVDAAVAFLAEGVIYGIKNRNSICCSCCH